MASQSAVRIVGSGVQGWQMTGESRRRRVLYLNLTNFYNRATHKGIAEYAAQHGWSLSYIATTITDELLFHLRAVDGLIVHGLWDQSRLDSLRAAKDLPIVTTGLCPPANRVKQVLFDDARISQLAFQHLADRGFTRLFMVGRGNDRNYPRYRHFEAAARQYAGVEIGLYSVAELTPDLFDMIPRPFGLALSNDTLATDVMFRLEDHGLRIPLDVAVLGCDNDLLFCETAPVPLSSIDINSARRGTVAAEYLDRMMCGEDVGDEVALIEPNRVVVRASTDIYAVTHQPTERALHHIREHLHLQELTIADIVRASGIARRALESAFKEHLSETIANVLLRHRIDWAIELIRQDDLTMADIARTCGFSSPQAMSRSFKRVLDRSPSAYRPSDHLTGD